jgi:hypothetical protein
MKSNSTVKGEEHAVKYVLSCHLRNKNRLEDGVLPGGL